MDSELPEEVLSSAIRLKIAAAVALRPRTLRELAGLTGISVQGVIRHLNRLESIGLVSERRIAVRNLQARIVYSHGTRTVGDYSTGDLTILKSSGQRSPTAGALAKEASPEQVAGEIIVQRRRVREQARRLGRSIEDLSASQDALGSRLDAMTLTAEERLILEVTLTEETIEDGIKVLTRYYGLQDRRSIEAALAKARRIVR